MPPANDCLSSRRQLIERLLEGLLRLHHHVAPTRSRHQPTLLWLRYLYPDRVAILIRFACLLITVYVVCLRCDFFRLALYHKQND